MLKKFNLCEGCKIVHNIIVLCKFGTLVHDILQHLNINHYTKFKTLFLALYIFFVLLAYVEFHFEMEIIYYTGCIKKAEQI